MHVVECFQAVASVDDTILILGSMPGVASLQQSQYYAHPKNLFWDIMGEFFGAGRELPYAQRLRHLQASQVALWDVAARCQRSGSLDRSIRSDSVVVNDFQALFLQCTNIRGVFFNGTKAAELFRRLVLPGLPDETRSAIPFQTLPSTSPANAAINAAEKIRRWRQILLPVSTDQG